MSVLHDGMCAVEESTIIIIFLGFSLQTLFNIMEERFKKLMNFDVSAV